MNTHNQRETNEGIMSVCLSAEGELGGKCVISGGAEVEAAVMVGSSSPRMQIETTRGAGGRRQL